MIDVLGEAWAQRMARFDREGRRRDGETDRDLWRFEGRRELLLFACDTLGGDRRLWGASLDTFACTDKSKAREQREALEAAERYAQKIATDLRSGRNLILFGMPGTGKDHLAMGVAKRVFAETGIAAVRNDGPTIQEEVRSAIREEQGDKVVARYANASLLWLSDPCLAGKSLTDFQMDWFSRLVDGRYKACLPTIVTINAESGGQIAKMLGPASFDRLKSNCEYRFFDWESYRQADRRPIPAEVRMPFSGEPVESIIARVQADRSRPPSKYKTLSLGSSRIPKGMIREEWDKLRDFEKMDVGEQYED